LARVRVREAQVRITKSKKITDNNNWMRHERMLRIGRQIIRVSKGLSLCFSEFATRIRKLTS